MTHPTNLDLDDIMAEHQRSMTGPDGEAYCEGCDDWDWPCLTYRLAERARDAETRVAAVEAEISRSTLYDEAENRVVAVSDLRAVLGSDTTGVQH